MARRSRTKGAYTISVVAEQFDIHPQTLRLYEREGLLKPSRTDGNTRMYTDTDMERLEVILSLTRDLGVNLAGVEIILNMRVKMEEMQAQMRQFVGYVNENLGSIPKDAEDHLSMSLVRVGSRAPVPAPKPARKKAAKRTIKHKP
ncbi:MAG: helix-turn-helix transcriptional regulator [Acidobacteria bacterium]|nr:helix-turn-helix transcriptional regulator [Acidobacteriota bacterium]MDA1234696.1 helix-turn-helix transcriptional regulator [Acidobacteriota bacterium]